MINKLFLKKIWALGMFVGLLSVISMTSILVFDQIDILFRDDSILCKEILDFMLDDPDHMRIHNDYPGMMLEIHLINDGRC